MTTAEGKPKAHGRRGRRAHGAHAELAGGRLEGSRRNDAHAQNHLVQYREKEAASRGRASDLEKRSEGQDLGT